MDMKCIGLASLLGLLWASAAVADDAETGPRITAAWGMPTDGREVTVVGYEFGSHTLQLESSV
ncbi:MAG: hypothetical protein HKO53_13945, partial [Gemmatimonadetes bacterium]|nr:hypothetical protein [Gemmatimonadota bacterium]